MCKNITDDDGNTIGIFDSKKAKGAHSDRNGVIYGAKCRSEEEISTFLANEGEMKVQYFSNKLDMKKMDGRPTFSKNSYFGAYRLYADRHYYTRTQL